MPAEKSQTSYSEILRDEPATDGTEEGMNQDKLEGWRRIENAAVEAEDGARAAARAKSADHRELAAHAKLLRKHANDLWRECLGSSLTPLAPVPESTQVSRSLLAPTPELEMLIAAWRRAQARAHAAEVRAVHAFSRLADGGEDEAAVAWQAEALMLRGEAAARLRRVYEAAAQLRSKR